MTRQAASIRWTFVVLALMAFPALAQDAPPGDPPMPGFMQPGSGPLQLLPPDAGPQPLPEAATPYAPSTAPATSPADESRALAAVPADSFISRRQIIPPMRPSPSPSCTQRRACQKGTR